MDALNALIAAGGFVLALVMFGLTWIRPAAKQRREFYREALGHPGGDGLPARSSLFESVEQLQAALNNGLRADVRAAREEATRAHQEAADGRTESRRDVNALRADIDNYANVAAHDFADIWRHLRDAGLDRRQGDD